MYLCLVEYNMQYVYINASTFLNNLKVPKSNKTTANTNNITTTTCTTTTTSNTSKNTLMELIFHTRCVPSIDEIKLSEEVIHFLSTMQLDILSDDHPRMLFLSTYGTGRTVLLEAKAKQILSRSGHDPIEFSSNYVLDKAEHDFLQAAKQDSTKPHFGKAKQSHEKTKQALKSDPKVVFIIFKKNQTSLLASQLQLSFKKEISEGILFLHSLLENGNCLFLLTRKVKNSLKFPF